MGRIIFAADHPLVRNGTYDQEGYTLKERRALARRQRLGADGGGSAHLGTGSATPSAADASASAPGFVHHHTTERTTTMFTSDNIQAFFKKGTLKISKTDEGEWRRLAEATLVIEPFTEALARELGDEVADHLFGEDGRIRDEVEAIDLRVRAGLQHVTVRHDEAMEPTAILSPTSVKDVTCSRKEDDKAGRQWLVCSFLLVFSLEERAARNFVLDEFGKLLLWTFQRMQPELEGLARVKEAGARLAGMADKDGITSVTLSTGDMSVTLDKEDAPRLREEAADLRRQRKTDHTAH